MNYQRKNCNVVFAFTLESKTHIDCAHLDDSQVFDKPGKQVLCQYRGCAKIDLHFGIRYRLLRHVCRIQAKIFQMLIMPEVICLLLSRIARREPGEKMRDHLRIHKGDRVKHQKTHRFVQHPTFNSKWQKWLQIIFVIFFRYLCSGIWTRYCTLLPNIFQ